MVTINTFLQLIGLILEIVGVVCMANMYVKVKPTRKIVNLLLSALIGGKKFRGATSKGVYRTDNIGISLRGLALIGVGFCVQATGILLTFFVQNPST